MGVGDEGDETARRDFMRDPDSPLDVPDSPLDVPVVYFEPDPTSNPITLSLTLTLSLN